jgi:hypothetical protein
LVGIEGGGGPICAEEKEIVNSEKKIKIFFIGYF